MLFCSTRNSETRRTFRGRSRGRRRRSRCLVLIWLRSGRRRLGGCALLCRRARSRRWTLNRRRRGLSGRRRRCGGTLRRGRGLRCLRRRRGRWCCRVRRARCCGFGGGASSVGVAGARLLPLDPSLRLLHRLAHLRDKVYLTSSCYSFTSPCPRCRVGSVERVGR